MPGVESLGQNAYFNVAQAVASQTAAQTSRKEAAEKTNKTGKKSFASAYEKSLAEKELLDAGLPAEIAGMEIEEAAIFLKDKADIAADKLLESQLPEVFAEYRQSVSQFVRFIVRNNFDVVKHNPSKLMIRRHKMDPRKSIDPKVTVQVVNQKLDDLARWLLSSQKKQLGLLAKVNEINGLLVDLMAM